ncbi:MAG: alpha/beta hydrolase [Pseudomonadota bacterium]
MMCDGRLFAPQIAQLGAGRVSAPALDQADSISAIAADILEKAPETFALGGLSMGGIVAMEIVAQAPGRVTRLALMDTNPLAERPVVKARRGLQMAAVGEGRLTEVMRDEMKPNYLAPGPRRGAVLDTVLEMALGLGAEVFLAQSRALMDRSDQTATLSRFKGPSLILCGQHDALCPVKRHEFMATLMPQAELVVVEGAGHLPTLEAPEVVTAALTRWLAA